MTTSQPSRCAVNTKVIGRSSSHLERAHARIFGCVPGRRLPPDHRWPQTIAPAIWDSLDASEQALLETRARLDVDGPG